MSEHPETTPTTEALADLEEAAQEEAAAVEETVDEIVEEVQQEVAASSEVAAEAAAEVAETVEEAVEEATNANPSLDPAVHGDEVYNHVLQRLVADGHIASPAIAEEAAGGAEHEVEVAAEAPAEVVEEAAPARDRIAPRSEHWWYQPRRLFGRNR